MRASLSLNRGGQGNRRKRLLMLLLLMMMMMITSMKMGFIIVGQSISFGERTWTESLCSSNNEKGWD